MLKGASDFESDGFDKRVEKREQSWEIDGESIDEAGDVE